MDIKRIKLVLWIAAAIVLAAAAVCVYNITAYPLTLEDIYAEYESGRALAFEQEHGLQIFVTAGETGYICSAYSESMLMKRYRLSVQFEYENTFDTLVAGKRHVFELELTGQSIELTSTDIPRFRVQPLINASFVVVIVVFVINKTYSDKKGAQSEK